MSKLKIEFEGETFQELINNIHAGYSKLASDLGGTNVKDPTASTLSKSTKAEASVDVEEPKKSRGRPKKEKEPEPEVDLDSDESEVDEFDDLGTDESEDVPSLDMETDVMPAFRDYKNRMEKKLKDKDKALSEVRKVLSKFGVKNVRDLQEKDFAAAMDAVK